MPPQPRTVDRLIARIAAEPAAMLRELTGLLSGAVGIAV
jgi:hypothetical protein